MCVLLMSLDDLKVHLSGDGLSAPYTFSEGQIRDCLHNWKGRKKNECDVLVGVQCEVGGWLGRCVSTL